MKDNERGTDGERQNHASGDLVKRSIDVFKGKVTEAGRGSVGQQRHLLKTQGEPETDDVKTNHRNEPLHSLLVKVQWDFEQTGSVARQE